MKIRTFITILAGTLMFSACGNVKNFDGNANSACENTENAPILLKKQGVFSAGGIVKTAAGTFDSENHWEATGAGQTLHADHANVFFQIPKNASRAPLIFLHGYGQSRVCWQSTPDGNDGWSDIFLRKNRAIFLIDGPRRGAAGTSSVPVEIGGRGFEQRWFTQFRLGRWRDGNAVFNAGTQFPSDARSLDQFFRQMTPDTGMRSDMGADFDREMVANAVAAAIDRATEILGEKCVLFAHSQGGRAAYCVPARTQNLAAIVAIEPGGAPAIDSAEFAEIVRQKIPVLFVFGDFIDNGDERILATAAWRKMRQQCYDFAEAARAAGTFCEVIDLPKIGIRGNSHFLFQERNNAEIADVIERWLRERE